MSELSSKRLAFVTGGSGMLGTHLVGKLAKEGFRVRALVRPTSDTEGLVKAGAELVTGDMTDPPEKFAEHLKGVTHVFHCAALVADWADRDQMYQVNVTGLENLLNACVGLPVRRIVVLGSLAIYGLGKQEDINESEPFVYSGDNYNYTKIESEKLCRRFADEHKLPVVTLRPPYVYGEGDRQLMSRLCTALRDGSFVYLDGGNIPFELAYAGNVVDAMFRAGTAELEPGEDFIITDGEPVTRRKLVETICEVMGYKPPTASVPVWLAKFFCPIYEFKARIFASKKPPKVNRFRLKFMGTHLTFDITKARKLLSYEPPFRPDEALVRSVRWFRDRHPELLPDVGGKA